MVFQPFVWLNAQIFIDKNNLYIFLAFEKSEPECTKFYGLFGKEEEKKTSMHPVHHMLGGKV